jgi:hypothetical protein
MTVASLTPAAHLKTTVWMENLFPLHTYAALVLIQRAACGMQPASGRTPGGGALRLSMIIRRLQPTAKRH